MKSIKPIKDAQCVPSKLTREHRLQPVQLVLSGRTSQNPHQVFRLTSWQQRMARLFAAQRY